MVPDWWEHFWWVYLRQKQSVLLPEFPWLEYIILRDTSVPTSLRIKNWSLLLSVWWRPAATHIWWWSRITVNMRSSDGPEMMRREKLLTRWLVPSDWDIPAVPRLTRCRRRAIRMPSTSPEQQWRRMNMISASAV